MPRTSIDNLLSEAVLLPIKEAARQLGFWIGAAGRRLERSTPPELEGALA